VPGWRRIKKWGKLRINCHSEGRTLKGVEIKAQESGFRPDSRKDRAPEEPLGHPKRVGIDEDMLTPGGAAIILQTKKEKKEKKKKKKTQP